MHLFSTAIVLSFLFSSLFVPSGVLAESLEVQCSELNAYIATLDSKISSLKLRKLTDAGGIRSDSSLSHLSPEAKQRIINSSNDSTSNTIALWQDLRERKVINYNTYCVNTPAKQYSCPAGSQLLSDGETCECKSDYVLNQQQNGCVKFVKNKPAKIEKPAPIEEKPTPPKNPSCTEGYELSLNNAYCVKIPKNAHAVNTPYDVWLCNDGFVESGNTCVLPKPTEDETAKEEVNGVEVKEEITTDVTEKSKNSGVWGWLKSLFRK